MEAHDFRVYFTPLAGVLFTVPSRYCALSVAACSLPWTVVSPASDQVLRAWPYSGTQPVSMCDAYGTITRSGAVFQTASAITGGHCRGRQTSLLRPTTPVWQRLAPWHHTSLGITRFVRHYYGCSSLFLRLLRCFSSPGALGHQDRTAEAVSCLIRRSLDHGLQAAPQSISERCPVLHRHAAPGHPSCAHRVFPLHWSTVDHARVYNNNQKLCSWYSAGC